MSRTVLTNSASSARSHFRWTRCVEAGCLPRHTPGRRSVTGLIGRGTNPPPQLGQTLKAPTRRSARRTCTHMCRCARPSHAVEGPCRNTRSWASVAACARSDAASQLSELPARHARHFVCRGAPDRAAAEHARQRLAQIADAVRLAGDPRMQRQVERRAAFVVQEGERLGDVVGPHRRRARGAATCIPGRSIPAAAAAPPGPRSSRNGRSSFAQSVV